MISKSHVSALSWRAVLCASGLAAIAGVAQTAAAQVAGEAAAAADADSPSAIGDIVVTAQRRSERLQDIPIAISAFDRGTLDKLNVSGIETIARQTPGFYLGAQGVARPALFIRGIGGLQNDAGSENPIGVFVDDVYLGRAAGTLNTLKDMERIEVLRGPQGTLYGRNTIGGAVNVISKAPSANFEGRAEIGISEDNGWNLLLAAGGPVNEEASVRARFAVWREKRDGYFTNLVSGKHLLGIDNVGGRARLAFDMSDNITLDLIADYSHDGDGSAFNGKHVGNAINPNGVFLASPALSALATTDFYADYHSGDATLDRTNYGFTGKLTADLGAAQLTSITGYRKLKLADGRDIDTSSLDAAYQNSGERSRQYTQELRLSSVEGESLSFGGHVNWLVGAFYYNDHSYHFDQFQLASQSVVAALGRPRSRADAYYTTDSYAFFGQVGVKPIDNLEVQLGGRYSHDKKTGDLIGSNTNPGLPLIAVPYATGKIGRSWSSFDPKAVITYHFTRDINIYASYSRGFKSGGFQFVGLSEAQARLIYNPEKLEAWEAGFKSLLMGGKIKLNLAAFDYKYKNMQVRRNVPISASQIAVLVTNAGASKIRGFDVELALKPMSLIEVGGTFNYLDAKFTNYIFSAPGAVPTPAQDFSGTRLPRTPKGSLSLYGELNVPMRTGEISLRADYTHRSGFFFEPGEGNILYGPTVPLTVQDGYGTIDLRAIYTLDRFSASVFATNLTGKKYLQNAVSLGTTTVYYPATPRIIGGRLSYNF